MQGKAPESVCLRAGPALRLQQFSTSYPPEAQGLHTLP